MRLGSVDGVVWLSAGAATGFLGLCVGACWARVATNNRPAQVTIAERRKTTRFMDLPLFYLRRGGGGGGVQVGKSFGVRPWSRIGSVRGLIIVLLAASAWAQSVHLPAPIFPADNEKPKEGGAAELLEAVCPGKVVTGKEITCGDMCPEFTGFS